MIDPAVQLVVRFALALVMADAARHKLADPARFREAVVRYEILPPALAGMFAAVVPFAEIALAVLIACGLVLPSAGVALAALLAVYAAAIAVNVRRGRRDLDCGCTGPASATPVSVALVARNVMLAAAALLLTVPVAARELALLDVAGIVGSTVTLAACWSACERMLALAPRVALARRRSPNDGAAPRRSR